MVKLKSVGNFLKAKNLLLNELVLPLQFLFFQGRGYHTSMTSGDLVHAQIICRPPESNVVHNKVKQYQGEGGYK